VRGNTEVYRFCRINPYDSFIHFIPRPVKRILRAVLRFVNYKWLIKYSVLYNTEQVNLVKGLAGFDTLVIFFNIMLDGVAGGMMAIDRFVYHSEKFGKKHNFTVIQSGFPFSFACTKNKYYDWHKPIVDFTYIIKYLQPKKLLLNIPEYYCSEYINSLSATMRRWLYTIPDLRINILDQNDELMPVQYYIDKLRILANGKLTITTAHERYCSEGMSKKYSCPMYQLTPFMPDFYRASFNEKENIIVLSCDSHSMRMKVIDKIIHELSNNKIVAVKNMSFEEYKKIISRAKFTISFGEGWDGYFIEPYLSNSIGITVRHRKYFPEGFKNVSTVYDSWSELYVRIVGDIKHWDSCESIYYAVQREVETEIRKFINNERSEKDLEAFYERFIRQYDVSPKPP
jgi:hypothetical protein